jgi:hypothetical protein
MMSMVYGKFYGTKQEVPTSSTVKKSSLTVKDAQSKHMILKSLRRINLNQRQPSRMTGDTDLTLKIIIG